MSLGMRKERARGMLLFMAALFMFAISDVVVKRATLSISVPLILWVRYVLHLSLIIPLGIHHLGRDLIPTRRPWLTLFRGVVQVGGSIFVFLAFRFLPLAETTALVFVSPLLVALLAGPLLHEKVGLKNWLAMGLGFSGVLLIARPGSEVSGIGVFYALGAAFCYSFYQILTRKLAASEPPLRQLFYIAVIGTFFSSLIVPFFWPSELPTSGQWIEMLSVGVCALVGHSMQIRAFHSAPASQLSPLLYSQLIWAVLFGWLVFAHLPDLSSLIGMLVIGVSGLMLMVRRSHWRKWRRFK